MEPFGAKHTTKANGLGRVCVQVKSDVVQKQLFSVEEDAIVGLQECQPRLQVQLCLLGKPDPVMRLHTYCKTEKSLEESSTWNDHSTCKIQKA